jgi:hypothetical protein
MPITHRPMRSPRLAVERAFGLDADMGWTGGAGWLPEGWIWVLSVSNALA